LWLFVPYPSICQGNLASFVFQVLEPSHFGRGPPAQVGARSGRNHTHVL
jgi:hypothetical protein